MGSTPTFGTRTASLLHQLACTGGYALAATLEEAGLIEPVQSTRVARTLYAFTQRGAPLGRAMAMAGDVADAEAGLAALLAAVT